MNKDSNALSNEQVAESVRETRRALGLTQEGLARVIGVTNNTVARWERGAWRPRRTTLLVLEMLRKGRLAPREF